MREFSRIVLFSLGSSVIISSGKITLHFPDAIKNLMTSLIVKIRLIIRGISEYQVQCFGLFYSVKSLRFFRNIQYNLELSIIIIDFQVSLLIPHSSIFRGLWYTFRYRTALAITMVFVGWKVLGKNKQNHKMQKKAAANIICAILHFFVLF